MGRYIEAACRLCRREGIKLMLKGMRCDSAKCAMEKQWRQQPPGMHGWKRTRGTEYAVRLREKQKVKRYYGLMDAQFMRFFRMAAKFPGNTGLILLQFLERRLDNVVYKLGLALSRRNARQMVAHGLVHVNGKKVDRPSYLVNQGDRISIKPAERSRSFGKTIVAATEGQTLQGWLQLDRGNLEGTVLALPTREDVQIPVEENLIVEFCSR
jgi:small subunit ribosomal protein S4